MAFTKYYLAILSFIPSVLLQISPSLIASYSFTKFISIHFISTQLQFNSFIPIAVAIAIAAMSMEIATPFTVPIDTYPLLLFTFTSQSCSIDINISIDPYL